MPICLSSVVVVNFSLEKLIYQKRPDIFFSIFLWHEAFLGWYVSTVKSWIRLNRSKSNYSSFERSEKVQFWVLSYL